MTNTPTGILINAVQLASLMTAAAQLVQQVETIRQQTADNAPDVWQETTKDYSDAVDGYYQALQATTSEHYNDARLSGQHPAPDNTQAPPLPSSLESSPDIHAAGSAIAGAGPA